MSWRTLETRPLPTALDTYLVANAKGQVAPCIRGIIYNSPGTANDWNYGEEVIAWMPLPDPPKDIKKGHQEKLK